MPEPESPEEIGLDPEAHKIDALAREILRENHVHFRIRSIRVDEDMDEGALHLRCSLEQSQRGEQVALEGVGVGLIDAMFDGVTKAYADEYPSLKTIAVSAFTLTSEFERANGRKSDALAHAELGLQNSEGVQYLFRHASPSVTRSVVRVALTALSFFINSERAYVQLHLALKDAKERRRSDLVARYRTQMSTLVSATSYSEVIERLKADLD